MERFSIASVRPPTENFSLSITTHFYCPWGKCAFCPSVLFTDSKKFQRRTLFDIKKDIDNASNLNNILLKSGKISQLNILNAISLYPELRECISHLVYWHLYANGETAFLGGANPLLYKSDFIIEIINYLKDSFPSINRITCYGRTKTASKKGKSYFKALYDAGLDRIHVGLESGSDKVLQFVNKGVLSKNHILGGRNIIEGGLSLCVYVMPGLGGRKWSTQHAQETAKVINALEPDFVRLRTLEIFQFTSLYHKRKLGLFEELSEEEVIREDRILIENINCNTTITSDSASNLLIEIWGELPKEKEKILKSIDTYLSLNKDEKLEFSLKRRLEAFSSQYGELSNTIKRKLTNLNKESSKDEKYYKKKEQIVKYVRRRLIP